MDCTSRPKIDRMWRSAYSQGGVRRGCALRVAAFQESRRGPTGHPLPTTNSTSTNVGGGSQTPAVKPRTVLLSLERIPSLQPAVLAASLLEFSRQSSLESSFQQPAAADSSLGSGDDVQLQPPQLPGQLVSDIDGGTAPTVRSDASRHQAVEPVRLYDAVAKHIVQHVYDFDGPALVDVLQAFSSAGLGRSNRDVLAICCVALSDKVDELSAPQLTRLVVACAALELNPTELLAAVCAKAGEPATLSSFSAADLAALLEGLAQLGHRSPALFADAADVLATELQLAGGPPRAGRPALWPDQVVAAVWAVASEGLYHRHLFDGAGALLMDRLWDLGGNSLARLAWSFAVIRHADESHRGLWDRDLFEGIAAACLERGVSVLPARALVTLLWAFAAIPHYHGPLFDATAAGLVPHLNITAAHGPGAPGAVAPSDLVAVAWAVQRVAHAHVELMEAVGNAALAAVEDLDGEDLTTIALAFPAAKAYNEGFFKYLVGEAQARPQQFGQVALLDIIRLVSRVQYRDPKYYGPALQVLLDNVHHAYLDAPLDKAGCMNPFRFG